MDWISGIQRAVDYIEEHLSDELDYEAIARQSCSSPFHFQRVFSILCGYTLGEYIRARRLSVAGARLAAGDEKVIDVALDYGYDSPDSFAKAFRAFHGINPSQARGNGTMLKSFSRLNIQVVLKGGSVMNYRIEKKPAMRLTGFKRRFTGDPNDKGLQDHSFACSTRLEQYVLEGMDRNSGLMYNVLTNFGPDGYDYYIAYKLSQWALDNLEVELGEFAKRYEHLDIPEGLYVVCETEKCAFPIELADGLRRQIISEWLPSSGCVLRDAPEINVIHWPYEEGNEELANAHYVEIWLPVNKAE